MPPIVADLLVTLAGIATGIAVVLPWAIRRTGGRVS